MSSPKQVAAYGVADLEEFRARMARLQEDLQAPLNRGAFTASTDGACLGNPAGPGGWAAVVEHVGDDEHWDLWGHLSSTSNNRAEALGILAALEWVPVGSSLLVRADSELSVKIMNRVYKAKKNVDIWTVIRQTIDDRSLSVETQWVRGHAGDPGNERADRLAMAGALDRDPTLLGDLPRRAVPSVPSELVGLEPKTAWEREFLQSVGDQLRKGRALSPKQQAIVDRIRGYAP